MARKVKAIPSQLRLREVLDYNSETGIFLWKQRRGNQINPGDEAGHLIVGNKGKPYRGIVIDRVQYLAHRLAWVYVHGIEPEGLIDHINGDGFDNRICNLRVVTDAQNRQNARLNSNNKSGVKGVSFNSSAGKWQAQIRANGVFRYLGRFEKIEDAIDARIAAEIQFHGQYRWVDGREVSHESRQQ